MVTDLQYLTGLNLPRCQQFLRFCCITCKNNAAVSRYNPHDQRAFICIAVSAADRRADDLYCSIAQGIIWGIMALGLYITFRLLDIADLTVDGSFATGGAVAIMLITSGCPAWAALIAALLAGTAAGLCTGVLHTRLGIPAILSGILTQLALYSINLRIMGMSANRSANPDTFKLLITLEVVGVLQRVIALDGGEAARGLLRVLHIGGETPGVGEGMGGYCLAVGELPTLLQFDRVLGGILVRGDAFGHFKMLLAFRVEAHQTFEQVADDLAAAHFVGVARNQTVLRLAVVHGNQRGVAGIAGGGVVIG